MPQEFVVINQETHRHTRLRPVDNFTFAADFHLASVMLPEFGRVAASYPIVFLEEDESVGHRAVAMLGVEQGVNLHVDAQGQWTPGCYIPAIIRRHPFALLRTDDTDRFVVGIDNSGGLLNDSEGTPLFNDDGSPSKMCEDARQFLSELNQMENLTLEFARFLATHDLLTPLNMQIEQGGEMRNVTGAFVVHEERLGQLPAETFEDLRRRGYLAPLYAHLISLLQVDHLLARRNLRAATATA